MAGYSHKTWACPFFRWDERLCVRCEGGCMSFPDREALAQADVGNQETQALVDAVLTAVVLEHGERAMDPDAPEMALGWRLAVPRFSVKEMREKYEIHARRGEDGKYILGVMERRSDL